MCAFLNAAAEFSDPADPVRSTVEAHRRWVLSEFASVATDAGIEEVDTVARQLMILRDGAMVNGYLGDPTSLGASLAAAFTSVIVPAATP